MYEKVNKYHPDKVADRIAGAILDRAIFINPNAIAAIEVLIGHGDCTIINETNTPVDLKDVKAIVKRISGQKDIKVHLHTIPQDEHLADNQKEEVKCGDNGIFKGVPITEEQKKLIKISKELEDTYGTDGKYILNRDELIICQSYAKEELNKKYPNAIINPLGYWTGGIDVDSGATNRKLGSDMGDSVTGGGLMGKDTSKADVSVNIYCWLKAQELGCEVSTCCAIGDTTLKLLIDNRRYIIVPYGEIVKTAKEYISNLGGYEKFAEYGLLRVM